MKTSYEIIEIVNHNKNEGRPYWLAYEVRSFRWWQWGGVWSKNKISHVRSTISAKDCEYLLRKYRETKCSEYTKVIKKIN